MNSRISPAWHDSGGQKRYFYWPRQAVPERAQETSPEPQELALARPPVRPRAPPVRARTSAGSLSAADAFHARGWADDSRARALDQDRLAGGRAGLVGLQCYRERARVPRVDWALLDRRGDARHRPVIGVWLTKAEASVTAVGEACPACGGETQRVKRRRTHKLLSTLMGHRLTRRRCDVCSWSGLSVRY